MNPVSLRIYDLEAMRAEEREQEKYALQAFYAMQRQSKPVLVVKRSMWLAIIGGGAVGWALVWVAGKVAQAVLHHM